MSCADQGSVSEKSHKVNTEDGVNSLSLTEEPPIKKVVHNETIGLFAVNEHPELTKARARGWYLLTRCTVHVCNSSDMFVDYKPVAGHEVVLEDNSRVDVVGFGTVKLQLETGKVLTLENVFHIPEITKCLISVAKLRDMDFNVTFRSKKCIIDDGIEVVGKGYREDELYRLSLMGERPAKEVVLQGTISLCNICGKIGYCAQECKDKQSGSAKVVLEAIIGLGTRSNQKAQGWYLNLGSSEHVCYSRDMFVDYNPMKDHEVILDNYDHLDVAGIGTVVIRFNTDKVLTLSNVLHIPKISKCYVSVAKLDDLGYIITFVDGMGVITKSQEVIAKAYAVEHYVYQLLLTGMYVKKVIKQGDGMGGITTTYGGGQCVRKRGDVIIQKGFKDHLLYKMDFMKEPPIAAKLKIEFTIGLLMGDEHPELTKARARGWYLLPKCTMHVCNSRDMFVDYQPVTGHEAVLEDDSCVAVEGYGTVKLQLTTGKVLTLERVFHMPAISKCCISFGFLMEFGYGLGYDAHGCYVKKDDQIVGNCFIEDGMLRLGVIDEHSGGNKA